MAVEIGDLAVRNYAAFHERLSDEAQLAAMHAPLTRRVLLATAPRKSSTTTHCTSRSAAT